MKNSISCLVLLLVVLLTGCQVETPLLVTATPELPLQITQTPALSSATPDISSTRTTVPTLAATTTPMFPPEARLNSRCLGIESIPPINTTLSGVVVMESRVIVNGRYKGETYLLDLTTNESTTLEHASGTFVSPDATLIAYGRVVRDEQDRLVTHDLVISNASGQTLKEIPWEEEWQEVLGWLDNKQLAINWQAKGEQSYAQMFLNPFSGEEQFLYPNFPNSVNTSPAETLPYWKGRYGVAYDPSLTRAIYPQFLENDDKHITYALWDISKQQIVTNLESIFEVPSGDNGIYPMPYWSPDGSQFVVQGLVRVSEKLAEFELFRVGRNGKMEQLTNLTSIASIQDSNLSWSPNGRYIAMFLRIGNRRQAHLAILDTTTLQITDYCISVTSGNEEAPLPVWSLNNKQLLVTDSSFRRVILVDIEQGFAVQIAEHALPVGWMQK